MKARMHSIRYDTDGVEVDDLPTEIVASLEDMGWEESDGDVEMFVAENCADYISDKTGWCIFGCAFEIIK